MARLEDIPQPTRDNVLVLECTRVDAQPFVSGPPLSRRRVAILGSAALFPRGETPFLPCSTEFRVLPSSLDPGEILMSHVSINFDRTGWQRDINVVFPIDRLHELASDGLIGSVAAEHFSVMGSTDPKLMEESADSIAARRARLSCPSRRASPV